MQHNIEIAFSIAACIAFLYFLITKERTRKSNISKFHRRKRKPQCKRKKKTQQIKVLSTHTFKNDFTSSHINASWDEIQKH